MAAHLSCGPGAGGDQQYLHPYRGRLLLTKAGLAAKGNPEVLWRHLIERLPTGADKSMDRPSGWLHLVQIAGSADESLDLIADAMTATGWRQNGREPIGHYAVRDAISHTTAVLRNLDASSTGSFRRGRLAVDEAVRDLCDQIVRGQEIHN